jgi:hypothetical protein
MMEITLADVEIAIKVLTEFLKKQREAEIVLRRLGIGQKQVGMSGLSFEQFVNMAYQQVMEKKKLVEEGEAEVETKLTDEELSRIREIAEKLKVKSEKQIEK